jgi:hypothetical protein
MSCTFDTFKKNLTLLHFTFCTFVGSNDIRVGTMHTENTQCIHNTDWSPTGFVCTAVVICVAFFRVLVYDSNNQNHL